MESSLIEPAPHCHSLAQAAVLVQNGGVIAYPTEYCYGLGCDPENRAAVQRILTMKHRHHKHGLILIADHFDRVRRYVRDLPAATQAEMRAPWPGPVTWVLPARPRATRWVRGAQATIAIRIIRHPPAHALCRASGLALVSTSANRAHRPPLRTAAQVWREFGGEVDGLAAGALGRAHAPSVIRCGMTGAVLRGG